MALTFIPPDLIERAAREERWTDSDRRHCSRMLRQAFEESFQVKEIQRNVNGDREGSEVGRHFQQRGHPRAGSRCG
jgi:hypothetical protein